MDTSLFSHIPAFSNVKTPKIEYEFQVVCLDCEKYFGKSDVIWTLPYRKGVTENLMRYALKECITREKPYIGYFLKIISNKK